jgi:hypothetical protein
VVARRPDADAQAVDLLEVLPLLTPDRLRRQLERAIADAALGQLKRLLDAVVARITVERRACIQPYFFAPTVRALTAPRRRTTKPTNTSVPGPKLWLTTQAWGPVG